ncbi:phospholipase D-like domain-containing protein [Egbenema bharatensis]|uniref:phospholipase D-like domain-containing protein n=1 Tax=Egbenema bharatensis TaxID=3463334 RepID=UPI003A83F55F
MRLTLLFLLGVLLFLGFTHWRQSSALNPQPAAIPPLPQDPLIQVYFNQSQSASYTDPYRQQARSGDNLEQVIIEAIRSAKSSVDLAVQELNLPQIAQALVDQKQSGVSVRVVLENNYSRPMSSLSATEVAQLDDRSRRKYDEFVQLVDRDGNGQLSQAEINQGDALVMLRNAQIPFLDDTADGSKGSGLMHHKFVLVDNTTLIAGSANFTLSDIHGDFASPSSRGNANHLLRISSPAIVKPFSEEFNLMWGDGVGGQPDSLFGLQKPYRSPQTISLDNHSSITVQFSPTSSRLLWEQTTNGLIGRTLSQANQAVDLMLFVFSEQKLTDVLETNHQRGVSIRALIDSGFAYRDYSEALDMMGVAMPNSQCRYAENNRPWSRPIASVGVPDLPQGDLLHHKVGLLDRRMVITGSHNWSAAANEKNDENLLVIDNPIVAAHFQREFDRLYAGATLGLPVRIQEKIQQQQARCAS